jgi:phosphoserine phosphatase
MIAIFDIDYTLVDGSVFEKVINLKAPGKITRILRKYDSLEDRMIRVLYFIYKLGRKRFWNRIVNSIEKLKFREDMLKIIKELDEKNYIIIILSSNPQPIVDLICEKIRQKLNLKNPIIGFGSLDNYVLTNKEKTRILRKIKKIGEIFIYVEDYTSKSNNFVNTINLEDGKEINVKIPKLTKFNKEIYNKLKIMQLQHKYYGISS